MESGQRRTRLRFTPAPCSSLLAAGALLLASGCLSSDLLGPDAAQGIEGLVLAGPQCPVQRQDDPCPDAPYAAWIDVLDAGGERVTRVRSRENGRFRVGLRPGSYRLDPRQGDPFPIAEDVEVTVVRGTFAEVTILYDTGIR